MNASTLPNGWKNLHKMRSIRELVNALNDSLNATFKEVKSYGIARSVKRGEELLPVIDEQYIGIDDSFSLQVYHKITGITMSVPDTRQGYGRNFGDQVNTYAMQMIVANDSQKTKLMSDQIALVIQSMLYNITFPTDFFRSVDVSLRSVILNSEQVYQQEYRSDSFRLNEYQSLSQINYSVEIAFKPGCFVVCPEDLIHCKN